MTCDKKLNLSEPIEKRNLQKARIICTDRKGGKYSLVALVEIENMKTDKHTGEDKGFFETAVNYLPCGHFYEDHVDRSEDLVNVLPRVYQRVKGGFVLISPNF